MTANPVRVTSGVMILALVAACSGKGDDPSIKQLGLKTRDAQSALDQLGRNGLIEEGDEEGSVALTESGRDRAAKVR